MASNDNAVAAHYETSALYEKIIETLRAEGLAINGASDDLTPFDDLHLGGRGATLRLAEKAGITEKRALLDVGAGVGGPARTLAERFGCRVFGLELTESFCRAGGMLTTALGMDNRVTFVRGDALRLPFAAASFDLLWNQHFAMNIQHKADLYAEEYRVLKSGGALLLHEVVAGPEGPVLYPVPWAGDASISFLNGEDELKAKLEKVGFRVRLWEDDMAEALAWYGRVAERNKAEGPPVMGQQVVMGAKMGEMARNMRKNLLEKRIRVVQAVLDRP